MKTAREFYGYLYRVVPASDEKWIAAIEADRREVRAAALREAHAFLLARPHIIEPLEGLRMMAERVERGES